MRHETAADDIPYTEKDLDRSVVAVDQIRTARKTDQPAGELHHRVAILLGRSQRDARLRVGTAHRWAARFIFKSCSPTCGDVSLRQAPA